MLKLLLILAGVTNAEISDCNDENIDGLTTICLLGTYDKNSGYTKPLLVEELIDVFGIPEFNPKDKTITIMMRLMTMWNDTRLQVTSSDTK